MSKVARLIDDLRAARRGDIAFESMPGRITSHLKSSPESADELLRQLESAFEQQIIEPAQLKDLRTVILDTVSSRKGLAAAAFRAPPNPLASSRGSTGREPTPPPEVTPDGTILASSRPRVGSTHRDGPPSQREASPGQAHDQSRGTGTGPGTGSGTGTGTGGPISRSNIKIGTKLRDRFILDEVLGVGGMGTVYRGRDLLKVEARDRNPYVAIKVLNDDFKKRDDAFIVLQREASRQQRLAHPNIVTVYDFDRTGDIIFISMELLEGTPLDVFLKTHSRPRGGLPTERAMPLIEGMGAALTYAHEHGIVHADFKPSNCFILRDGKIKVLDFGIARAMKKPNQLDSELTVYDGSSLGAMTPAYASPEMLEQSADPDPRDDIYAFACVCYEVLSGWHPFNRVSALDARDQELKPKRLPGLTSKQNRALARALAFGRAERTPTVSEFIAQMGIGGERPPLWNRKSIAIAAAVAAVIVVGSAWYADRYPVSKTLSDLKSGNRQTMQAAIERIATLSASDRANVLKTGRESIIGYFGSQVQGMLETGEIDAASAKADGLLNAGLAMYPDATQLVTLRGEVAKRKERYLNELAEQYETYLAAGRLLRSGEKGDIQGVMQRIQLVNPRHPLLTDPRVAGAFANQAEAAIAAGNLATAHALVTDGTRLAPNDGVLRDVADKLANAEQQAERRRRSNELATQIDGQLAALTSLDALSPRLIEELGELRGLDPGNAALDRVRATVKPLFGKDYQAIASLASIDETDAMERRYAAALESMGLGDAAARIRARHTELTARHDKLVVQARTLAAAPGTKTTEGASIAQVLDELRKLSPADPEIESIITTAVSEQRRVAQRLSAEHEWNAARAAVNAVLALSTTPETKAQVAQDLENISQREADAARESAEAERVVAHRVERMKVEAAQTQLQAALDSFSPTTAGLAALGAKVSALATLDPGNAMIQSARTTAAQRIADAASTAAKAGKFNDARDLLTKAAADLPGVTAIAAARTQVDALQAEASKRAQDQVVADAQQKLRSLLEKAAPSDAGWQRDADAALAAVRKVASNDAANQARQQLTGVYLDAASRLVADKRFTAATQLLDKAEELTPKSPLVQARRAELTLASERLKSERAAEELAAKIDAAKQRFTHEIKSRQFDRARKTLSEVQAMGVKEDAFVTRDAPAMLVDGYLASAQAELKSGDYASAWQLGRSGAALQKDDPRFAQLRTDIDSAVSRRIDSLLASPAAIDGNALAALTAQYRSILPERYQAQSTDWVAKIKRRMTDSSNDPASYNAYLAAVKGAFTDVASLQALRPIEPKPTPAPTQTAPVAVAANKPASAPTTTSSPAGSTTAPATTTVSPPVAAPVSTPTQTPAVVAPTSASAQPPTAAATPAPEPNLMGNWCSDGLGLDFSATTYSFDIGGGRIIKYPVERYHYNDRTITMSWTDKTLGAMVTEFGDFSADGQSMVQLRGKTATGTEWKSYNRKFKRCK
jgi:serine/threonine protein kinase